MADKGIAMSDELRRYLLDHSLPRSATHAALVAATVETLGGLSMMQIAEEQGPVLTFLARLVGARRIIEVGTFTGLSALCLAEGLAEGGRLDCFDLSEEFVAVGRPHWAEAGVADRIDVHIGPAAETLARFRPDEPVDLAFIDADKPGYQRYFDLIVPMMRPGGLIAFDNSLYFGAVLEDHGDADVQAIQAVNRSVADDERVDTVLLNVGDGLLLARVR